MKLNASIKDVCHTNKIIQPLFWIKEVDANWSERLPGQHPVNTNHQLNLFILFQPHFLSPNFNYVLSMKFQVGYKPVCFYIATIYSMILYFDTGFYSVINNHWRTC